MGKSHTTAAAKQIHDETHSQFGRKMTKLTKAQHEYHIE